MSDLITLTINGKSIEAKEGETVLNTARANNIFIPAVCYLTRCSPTLACRLCLVESDGKQIYACNAKVKDGMNITTDTPNIAKERRAIMEVYDVNHPLQCGVCDQSGECELQNYSLYMKVDSQSYTIKDVARPAANWGVMKYDPGLCIVCEKCVTVCKDMIGSNALSTVKRGSDAIEKTFKDTMPKDAYSMWNKLNKSLIGFEEDNCTDCGECISVCPVGALVSSDFQYKSNAWELNRIPAANPHSSDCAFMYYETKHESIENAEKKIYRVTNEHHYSTLNGAARFGYDFENKVQGKDEESFLKAVEAFKDADSIIFNSYITNEEAYILQRIANKTGAKLVNKDAYKYKKFLENYSSNSGTSLYSSTLKDVHDSNFVISLGAYLKSDLPNARYAFNNSVIMNKGAAIYFHPVADPVMEKIGKKGKTTEFIYHKPLKEEFVLYFILDKFGKELPENIQEYIDSFKETRTKTIIETVKETVVEIIKDEETGEEKEKKKVVSKKVNKDVDFEYTTLLDEIGTDAKFLDTLEALLAKKDTYSLIVGEDLYTHPKSENLGKLCGLVDKYTDFNIVIIPSQTNTLGVSLICDVVETASGKTVGYNEKADFQVSALGDGDLDMPALNQQEGTFTNCDKKLIPTNAAIHYKGYVLNDIANAILDDDIEYTIEYTQELPLEAGFKGIDFDRLPNHFGNDRVEYRGYNIAPKATTTRLEAEPASKEEISLEENELIIYRANPINQFNEFTAIAHEFAKDLQSGIFVSEELFEKLELEKDDKVKVASNGKELELNVFVDGQIAGEIAYVSTFQKDLDTKSLFDGYRFTKAVIKKGVIMETGFIIETIIKAIVVLAVFSALAGFTTYIERKVLAFMQRRLGPMNVGPHGVLQLAADGIKLFTKEDFVPQNAAKPVFMIAPIITAATAFIAMTAVPFFPEFELFGYTVRPIIADINVGVLFVMGVASVGLYGPLLGGMSSANKWSLLGGARTAIQLLSYEVVSGLALLAPLMLVGSLSLIDINAYQADGVSSWLVWSQPLAFVLFVIAGFAETNRTPFDLLEHEAEIIAGYATEYSGMRWGMFFIGEYANLFTICFLVSLIFLGGYNDLWFIPGGLAIILKVMFLVFFFLWTRAAWPHIRPDQLMWLCWKILMPLAVINILITGFVMMF